MRRPRYAFPVICFTLNRPKELSFTFADVVINQSSRPYYNDDYVVTPRVFEQTLETKEKTMRDDLTITEIPLAEVSNPQGGITATIG